MRCWGDAGKIRGGEWKVKGWKVNRHIQFKDVKV